MCSDLLMDIEIAGDVLKTTVETLKYLPMNIANGYCRQEYQTVTEIKLFVSFILQ